MHSAVVYLSLSSILVTFAKLCERVLDFCRNEHRYPHCTTSGQRLGKGISPADPSVGLMSTTFGPLRTTNPRFLGCIPSTPVSACLPVMLRYKIAYSRIPRPLHPLQGSLTDRTPSISQSLPHQPLILTYTKHHETGVKPRHTFPPTHKLHFQTLIHIARQIQYTLPFLLFGSWTVPCASWTTAIASSS